MKRTCGIIACLTLAMLVLSLPRASQAQMPTLETRDSRPPVSSDVSRLGEARLSKSFCGDGIVDRERGEECDYAMTAEETQKYCTITPVPAQLYPFICTTDCKCSLCGNANWDSQAGEECDTKEGDVGIFRHCNYTKKTSGIPYVCLDDCTCTLCGNNQLDQGEACDPTAPDPDAPCAGGTCSAECTCIPPEVPPPAEQPTPTPEPTAPVGEKSCTIKAVGFSGPAAEEYVKSLNEEARNILKYYGFELDVDLFGEEGYTAMQATLTMPQTAAPAGTSIASGDLVRSDAAILLGASAVIQTEGFPLKDPTQFVYRPAAEAIEAAVLVFPIGPSELGQTKAKALGITKDVVLPNLAAVAGLGQLGIDLQSVVGQLGIDSIDLKYTGPTNMSLNNVITWKIERTTGLEKATDIGSTVHALEYKMPWASPAFPSVEGYEEPKIDPAWIERRSATDVLDKLNLLAADWKASGRPVNCDILLGLTGVYDPSLSLKFVIVEDTVAIDPLTKGATVSTPVSQGLGSFSVITERAVGGGGCTLVNQSQGLLEMLLMMGAALVGFAGFAVVRGGHRKK